jgi:hypothetical protein
MQQCDIRWQGDHKTINGRQALKFIADFQPTLYTDTSTGDRVLGWTGQTLRGLLDQQAGSTLEPVAGMLVTASGKHDVLQFNTQIMLPLMHLAVKTLENELDAMKTLLHKTLLDQGIRINNTEKAIERINERLGDQQDPPPKNGYYHSICLIKRYPF